MQKPNDRLISRAIGICGALLLSSLLGCATQPEKFSEWSPPMSLGAIVNSAGDDAGSSISKDGLRLYFASNRPGGSGALDLYVARRASANDPWGPPQNLGPRVNSPSNEQTVWISPDDLRLYFASDRAGGSGGLDLYVSQRPDRNDEQGWGPAMNLGSSVNTPEPEFFGSILREPSGREILYFARGSVGARDLYMSVRGPDGLFALGVPIAELRHASDDARPAVRRDGLEMFFDSNRQGGALDIWVTTRAKTSDQWSPPVNVRALNSAALEARPSLSDDGTTIYFQSARPGGLGSNDLYVAKRSRLH